ncbi:TetR/AcrR family transcriptional regulator [Amycolatopsis minnesotensis]|uniref:TetR/AcrR family transcriptional regulator n=1 Tax=Amycolatopsis minnesotensis TaxID=337894 RepID=A0ABN2S134_9PSEU
MSDARDFEALPRGRHRLSREEVRASQRGRLLLGMAEVVAEKGYVRTTVADVLKKVHVSRETFYQHFTDKEQCFLTVLDSASALFAGALTEYAGPEGAASVLERFERVLTAYFATLAEEAAIARVFFVECYSAGPAAQRKRVEIADRFVDLLDAALAMEPGWLALPDHRFTCRILTGGISSLVANALIAGRAEELRTLAPKVVELAKHLIAH